MGFDMLNGGKPTRAQCREAAEEVPDEDSGLVMPLSIPLIAGPGAIVTIITITIGTQMLLGGLKNFFAS